MKRRTLCIYVLVIILNIIFLTGCSNNVTDKSINVEFQGKTYAGKYTGMFEKGKANGVGEFNYKKEDDYIIYNGNFEKGILKGEGTLDTNLYTIQFNEGIRTGEFKGQVFDGLAKGTGIFTAINKDNIKYTYDGQWDKGTFNGQGVLNWEDDDTLDYIGTFVNGDFTPTPKECFFSLATYPYMPFKISSKAQQFLNENEKIFPSSYLNEVSIHVDNSIKYKHLNKSPQEYGDKIVFVKGYVAQIFERTFINDYTLTELLISDENFNYYYVFYLGKCDFFEGDEISVYGLPLGGSSFENVSGGETLVQVLAGAYMR